MKNIFFLKGLRKQRPVLLISLFLLISSSCISNEKKVLFQLWKNKSRLLDYSAKKVFYKAPPKPYKKKRHPELDGLWQNQKLGTSISYLSSCSYAPFSLRDVKRDILSQFSSYKVLRHLSGKKSMYNTISVRHPNREKTMLALHIFRKKNCFYVLNFVANSLKHFKKEQVYFDNFIKSFKAIGQRGQN